MQQGLTGAAQGACLAVSQGHRPLANRAVVISDHLALSAVYELALSVARGRHSIAAYLGAVTSRGWRDLQFSKGALHWQRFVTTAADRRAAVGAERRAIPAGLAGPTHHKLLRHPPE